MKHLFTRLSLLSQRQLNYLKGLHAVYAGAHILIAVFVFIFPPRLGWEWFSVLPAAMATWNLIELARVLVALDCTEGWIKVRIW